jgi:UDP-2,4-diacetamido-2,4,6-trideoxy-beta-L-altropyranose hydrolase
MATFSDLLLIRADGSLLIGTGHVMRCLALAQAWQRTGGRVVFAQAESTPALQRRLRGDAIEIVQLDAIRGSLEDAAQTAELAKHREASVVADGYCFGADWQKEIKNSGLWLLLWDDYGQAEHYYADLILNQNIHANPKMYSRREPETRLIMGPRYVQLRQEFLDWSHQRRYIPPVARKVLVTLGGSDPDNATAKVIQALACLHDAEVVVVVGGSNPNVAFFQSPAMSGQALPFRLLVDPPNMPELMAWADVAVSAGGSTAWELAFMGLPSLVIALSKDQAEIAAALDRSGVSVCLGEDRQLSIEQLATTLKTVLADLSLRERMNRRGRQLVDGLGNCRVVTRLRAAGLTLRRAVTQDCRLIWEWANDPEVRAASFSSDPISWESHVRWYSAKLSDPNCFFYVATDENGSPLGQIRFETAGAEGVVSLSIAPYARGKGLGPALIAQGTDRFIAQSNARVVHAYVKTDNPVSVNSFEKADFNDAGTTDICGNPARHFVLCRETT